MATWTSVGSWRATTSSRDLGGKGMPTWKARPGHRIVACSRCHCHYQALEELSETPCPKCGCVTKRSLGKTKRSLTKAEYHPSEGEAGWLAGVFEARGSLTGGNRKTLTVLERRGSVAPEVITRVQRIMGNRGHLQAMHARTVRFRDGRGEYYRPYHPCSMWVLHGAANILHFQTIVAPHLTDGGRARFTEFWSTLLGEAS